MSNKIKKKKTEFVLDPETPVVYDGTKILFRMLGKPVPLQRACLSASMHLYNPNKAETTSFQSVLKQILREQHIEKPVFAKGTRLHLKVHFQLEDCASRSPDVDNLCKFVMDACEKYMFIDDRMIFTLTATKISGKGKGKAGWTHVELYKCVA